MRRTLHRILTAIQLTRLTMAFGAVSDLWLVIMLTQAGEKPPGDIAIHGMNTAVALLLGAVVAVGLFAYGASLNDVLDVRHDSAFSPDRPIPAGRIRAGQAIVVTVGALLVAMLAGQAMGRWSLQLTLLTAVGILFYNAAGKFIPAAGIVSIGLIHAVHMIIPNVRLTFTWPVWLVLTHAMVVALGAYMYEGKRPRVGTHTLVVIASSWVCWSIAIVAWGVWRGGWWPEGSSAVGIVWPFVALAAFVAVARWKTANVPGHVGAEKLRRYGAMWQALYGSAWLFALGLNRQAGALLVVAVAGFALMTLIKEVISQLAKPVTYRE